MLHTHPSTSIFKRQAWRVTAAAVFGVAVCVAAFLATSTLTRMLSQQPVVAITAPNVDVAAGGASSTDRLIGTLQERLRQQPNDHATQTQLGLAYLQRA